jgi:hypothetical protein
VKLPENVKAVREVLSEWPKPEQSGGKCSPGLDGVEGQMFGARVLSPVGI